MMMMVMMTVQAVFDFSFDSLRVGRDIDWRLVAGEHQDEDQAAASWCSRPAPSAEAAANDASVGRDRNGRVREAATDSERVPSTQLTGHVALDVVARPPCAEIDGGKSLGKI